MYRFRHGPLPLITEANRDFLAGFDGRFGHFPRQRLQHRLFHVKTGLARQGATRDCLRAMIPSRTALRRALPASSRSGRSTNSTVFGTL